MTGEPSAQTRVLFIASGDKHLLQRITQRQNGRLNQYRIHDVVSIAGKVPGGLVPGWALARIENDGPIQLAEESQPASEVPIITFRGVTQHLHYTTVTQRQVLDMRSRAELEPSNETTAVLIPIRKSLKWWQLAQDERQVYFQTSDEHEDHIAIGLRYADRVFRKLYHCRYTSPPAVYDFLTYFEFHSSHKDDFRMLLNELRNTVRNPEWAYIELEFEIWMTKIR